MKKMTRRSCFIMFSISPLAGCLSDDKTVPRLGTIYLENTLSHDIVATVGVEKDGELVYEEPHLLNAYEDSDRRGGTNVTESWMGDQVYYKVKVSAPDIDTQEFSTEDYLNVYDKSDKEYFSLHSSIEPEGIDFRVGDYNTD